ncbi:hypothetical protein P8C59_000220 [Phyllachora maydis]|uniref:Uncharacterized protein n=1 Tax=Phyllachora maydis TaxID=1825666 RepID=A0AAD9MAY7_9PEZI|nr:hypothetical protein P8C59_000220 [Phyllachora maydis]
MFLRYSFPLIIVINSGSKFKDAFFAYVEALSSLDEALGAATAEPAKPADTTAVPAAAAKAATAEPTGAAAAAAAEAAAAEPAGAAAAAVIDDIGDTVPSVVSTLRAKAKAKAKEEEEEEEEEEDEEVVEEEEDIGGRGKKDEVLVLA